MKRVVAATATLCLLLLAACDSGPRPEPVVVYASDDGQGSLRQWFADFTEETGIPVTLRFEDSATNTANVIDDEGSPPVDVLLTSNVADIWRAADHGALRPIESEKIKAVPAQLRDPDGFWVGLQYRLAVIARGPQQSAPDVTVPTTYADLAEPQYRGQLCLSSSTLPVNRSLIAMMIAELGARPTELLVRGWIQNLALPTFATETELLAAINAGSCGYGVLSESIATGAEIIVPQGAYFDIDGLGVARHARYPESAQRLVDWLLAEKSFAMPASASSSDIGAAGWHNDDAVKLAERASYR